jgi:hypothetical protein
VPWALGKDLGGQGAGDLPDVLGLLPREDPVLSREQCSSAYCML